jgi:hypothetical protein
MPDRRVDRCFSRPCLGAQQTNGPRDRSVLTTKSPNFEQKATKETKNTRRVNARFALRRQHSDSWLSLRYLCFLLFKLLFCIGTARSTPDAPHTLRAAQLLVSSSLPLFPSVQTSVSIAHRTAFRGSYFRFCCYSRASQFFYSDPRPETRLSQPYWWNEKSWRFQRSSSRTNS